MKISNPAIDSFRMYIPITKVEFTPEGEKQLLEEKITISKAQIDKLKNGKIDVEEIDLGLDENEFKRVAYKPKELENNGISITLKVVEHYHFQEGTNTYLVLLINSKILKEKYLLGITKETIKDIWLELLSLELFYVEFEDFLNGTLVDVDIKADFKGLSSKEFGEYIRKLDHLNQGELHTGGKNMGLQYGYRTKGNFISKPYIKFYHKTIELKNHSKVFADNYLKNVDIKNLARVEGTIKNKRHFKSLGIKENTLGNLLEKLTEEKIIELISKLLGKHFKVGRSITMVGLKQELKGMGNVFLAMYIKAMLKQGMPFSMIENSIRWNLEEHKASKSTIARAIRKASKVCADLLTNDPEVKEEAGFFEFLSLLMGGNLNEQDS